MAPQNEQFLHFLDYPHCEYDSRAYAHHVSKTPFSWDLTHPDEYM
jgi:hypothetical protein